MENLNELIPIQENNGKKAVSARDLHLFLQCTERFQSWFDRQLQFDFVENVDFVGCKVFNTLANQELQDYVITIGMAKEISMIQRSERGKQARKYFIACEEVATGQKELSKKDLALMVIQSEEEKERLQIENKGLQQQIEEQRPAVVFTDSVKISSTNILMRDLAKIITQNGYEIGEVRLYDWMVENNFLIRDRRWSKSQNKYVNVYTPTQIAAKKKLFWVSERPINNPGQQPFIKYTCYVTGEGQVYFINKFNKLIAA